MLHTTQITEETKRWNQESRPFNKDRTKVSKKIHTVQSTNTTRACKLRSILFTAAGPVSQGPSVIPATNPTHCNRKIKKSLTPISSSLVSKRKYATS